MTRIQDLFGNIGANKQPVRHSVCKRSLSTEDDRFVLAIRKWAGREWHVNIYSQNVQICPNEWTNATFFKEHGWSWSYLPVSGSEKLDMDAEALTFWPLQFQILQQWPRQAAWLFGVEILFSTPSTHQPSFKQWCATVNLPKQWSFHLSSSRLSSLAQEPTKVTGIIPKELASHQAGFISDSFNKFIKIDQPENKKWMVCPRVLELKSVDGIYGSSGWLSASTKNTPNKTCNSWKKMW